MLLHVRDMKRISVLHAAIGRTASAGMSSTTSLRRELATSKSRPVAQCAIALHSDYYPVASYRQQTVRVDIDQIRTP